MIDRHFRLLLALAVLVGSLSQPVLAQFTLCQPTNISLSNAWAGANWNSFLNGYQISGACDWSYDCSSGNFGSCQLCLMTNILVDTNHDGTYTGLAGKHVDRTSQVGCGTTNVHGSLNAGPFPDMGSGIGSDVPDKVKFYAVGKAPGFQCSQDAADYDVLIVATGTTPPF